jgi:NADPH:quinone reductase-like Zn-dependent oxidoreductase
VRFSSTNHGAERATHGPFDLVVDCVGGYAASRCRALLAKGGVHIMVAGDTPAAVAAGKVKVNIAQRFPLASEEEAQALSQGGRMTGKIVLNP